DYQKAEFINIAAHELRTPLTAILGYAEVLQSSFESSPEKLSDEQRSYLEAVVRGGQRLNGVVKGLLRFADLNEGDLYPQGISRFLVLDLIEEVVSDLQHLAVPR